MNDKPLTSADRRRGAIALAPDKCTSCMICVRECPVWCISLEANREHDPAAGSRGRSKLVLTDFEIDYGLCMDCGICVDVCPTDALSWVPSKLSATPSPSELVADMAQLSAIGEADHRQP